MQRYCAVSLIDAKMAESVTVIFGGNEITVMFCRTEGFLLSIKFCIRKRLKFELPNNEVLPEHLSSVFGILIQIE